MAPRYSSKDSKPRALPFKSCPICSAVWPARDDFLRDPRISIIGYHVDFLDITAGLFLFNHACGTTISLAVSEFTDLYDGPVFKVRRTGLEDCPGYCLRENALDRCPAKCECAFAREIIRTVRTWPKEEREHLGGSLPDAADTSS